MEKQIDVTVLARPESGAPASVRWLICDNGMTVGSGAARYDPATGACAWEEERPPAEYEGQVRLAIARALAKTLKELD